MSDLREIFLQPECCADEHTGRLWCEDDAPVDCEDDDGNEIPWTRYVRADLHDALAAEVELLRKRLAELEHAEHNGDIWCERTSKAERELAEADALLRKWRRHFNTKAWQNAVDAHLSRKEQP